MKKQAVICAVLALIIGFGVAYCFKTGKEPGSVVTRGKSDILQRVKTTQNLSSAAASRSDTREIILSDDGCTLPSGVSETDGIVKITSGGIYTLQGQLTEGQIEVDAKANVTLILNGVSISCSDGAAINITNSQHTHIYLAEGSENTVTSGEKVEISSNEEIEADGAAIYSRDDLSFSGSGSLTVNGYINNAVATTDNLVILSGNITANRVNNGLKGKDSVTILNGNINILSGNDGIKANNEEVGVINITDGNITVKSYGDGISAETDLSISGGEINIDARGDLVSGDGQNTDIPGEMPTGDFTPGDIPAEGQTPGNSQGGFNPGNFNGNGGAESNMTPPEKPDNNTGTPPEKPDGDMTGGQQTEKGTMPQMPESSWEQAGGEEISGQKGGRPAGGFGGMEEQGHEVSAEAKGIKAGTDLTISGGKITVKSADDSLHSNGTITITGGEITIASGDDGIHAEDSVSIADGTITITQSYEGIEGHIITVDGGQIDLTASDDGFNAGGDASVSMPAITINNGNIYVHAQGDGLDSNGDLIFNGGFVTVDGPTSGGDSALDVGTENGGKMLAVGGTVIAAGSASMVENFDSSSSQPSITLYTDSTRRRGTVVTVANSSGKEIISYTSKKYFSGVIITSELFEKGETYTVTVGEESYEFTIDETVNSNKTETGGFGNTKQMPTAPKVSE